MNYIEVQQMRKQATLAKKAAPSLVGILKALIAATANGAGVGAVGAGIGAGINALRGKDAKSGAVRGFGIGAGMGFGGRLGAHTGFALQPYINNIDTALSAPGIGALIGEVAGGLTGNSLVNRYNNSKAAV